MPVIRIETRIAATPERCFDLARDVDLHQRSAAASSERAIAGVTSGKMGLGDTVTWRATHFGVPLRLSSRITEFDPPRRFVDEMVEGPFRRLRHVHAFEAIPGGTLMVDVFDYASPLGILGAVADALVLRRYLQHFLERRSAFLKRVAEATA
ncbi:MAG: SRPBCC family protein [Chloroflexi bacterium]|nr:MAG: SRPBCC family protein [Chloroflexota bacterium]